jgi:hypothetical protein
LAKFWGRGIRNNLRWPANVGLFAKSLANSRELPGSSTRRHLLDEVRPLMADLFRQQMVGDDPLLALLRTGLEFPHLSLSSPRQFGFLLDRLSSEQLTFNLNIRGVDDLRRSLDEASNRQSFSIVVAALIVGAAIVCHGRQSPQGQILSMFCLRRPASLASGCCSALSAAAAAVKPLANHRSLG